jgi:deferrochelatase/peroxidase EfeB
MPDRPLSSIQGNILKSFARDSARYLMLRFSEGAGADLCSRLGRILPNYVTSAWCQAEMTERWKQNGKKNGATAPVGMFGLSYTGYQRLGRQVHACTDPELGSNEFQHGFANGTYWPGSVDLWEPSYRIGLDAFLMLADSDAGRLAALTDRAQQDLKGTADVVVQECGSRLYADPSRPAAIEHFGFRDQVSRGVDPETLLTEESDSDPDSGVGCFGVFMKIEQHVDKFSQQVDELSSLYAKLHAPFPASKVRASTVGRYPDGKPMATTNGGFDDFDFRNAADADRCPMQAHIRVMNPRDGTSSNPVVRRGIPYGPGPSDGATPDASRGLLFLGLHRTLLDFLALMVRAKSLRDPLLSRSSLWDSTSTGPTHCPHGFRAQRWKIDGVEACYPFADVTTIRGGEYFYIPSMDFIHRLGSS